MITSSLPRPLRVATTLGSAATLVVGLVWLLVPDLNPYVDEQLSLLRLVVGLTPFTVGLTTLALVGTLLAAIAIVRPEAPGLRVVAPLVTLGFLAGVCSMTGLSLAGYTVALVLPVVAVVVGIVAAVKAPKARLPLAVVAILVTVLLVVGHAAWLGALSMVFSSLVTKLAMIGPELLLLATTALWLACTLRLATTSSAVQRLTPTVVRLRVPITIIAALGPVPYAVHRLTWLTPWPLFAPDFADAEVLAWGVALSAGAWMGAVLTIGLIRPWGERFPRWMPGLGGRVVPPATAIVPGSIVAGLLCLAAIPWLVLLSPSNPIPSAYFWLLPVWLWGPTLALAVWGYAGHRAATSASPATAAPARPPADQPLDQAGWAR